MKITEIAEYFRTNLYEMSNFFDKDTGLSSNTKLWIRVEPEVLPHVKYRIKIMHPQKGSAIFAIWGDEIQQVAGHWIVTGKDLKKIQMLVLLTRKEIIQHINGEISSIDLGNAFLKAKPEVEKI